MKRPSARRAKGSERAEVSTAEGSSSSDPPANTPLQPQDEVGEAKSGRRAAGRRVRARVRSAQPNAAGAVENRPAVSQQVRVRPARRRPPEHLQPAAVARPAEVSSPRRRQEPQTRAGQDGAVPRSPRLPPVFEYLFRRYFRVQTLGLEKIPEKGSAILLCNCGAMIPWEGVMLEAALHLEHPGARSLKWVVEDSVFRAPLLSVVLRRTGALPVSQLNDAQIRSRQELLAVFPEGVGGMGKPYRNRYALEPFSSGAYVEFALRTRAPVLPVAVIGAEEAYRVFYRAMGSSQLLGLPFRPLTPFFPWLGPLGMIPLPSSWRIVVGEAVTSLDAYPPEAAENAALVAELTQRLRLGLQNLVDLALADR